MTAKSLPVSASEFHLFIERVFEFADSAHTGAAAASSTPTPLVVPDTPVRLTRGHGGVFELLPAAGPGLEATPQLEAITGRGSRPRLLVITNPTRPARVNGFRAPRLMLLREGDRFRFDDSCSFRVAIYHRPRLGPVPE